MATILAYTSPAFGNLYPLLALLGELRGRGHRIVLRTMAAAVGIGNAMGLEASAIDARIEAVAITDWMDAIRARQCRTRFAPSASARHLRSST